MNDLIDRNTKFRTGKIAFITCNGVHIPSLGVHVLDWYETN